MYKDYKNDYQKWWVSSAGGKAFNITSYRSNNALDSNGNGDVYTLPVNGGAFQHWYLQ